MWKSIKYLYYKLYKLFVRINGKEDFPEYTAMLGVGTLFFFNFLAIISILNIIHPITLFPEISRVNFFRKWRDKRMISSFLSLSGGSSMLTTLSR